MTLKYIWSFVCLLTAASGVTVLYPSINGSEILSCTCPDHQCQRVFWYRLIQNRETPEFLVSTNNLNTAHYAQSLDPNRFKTTANDGTKVSFTLRIAGLQTDDAGFYSCLLSSQNSAQDPEGLMPDVYSIRPGESMSTLAPATVKSPKHPTKSCKPNKGSQKGCASLVLWSGIGAVLLLVVVLISTLYYFSRLPKKCRHRFAKKHQLC